MIIKIDVFLFNFYLIGLIQQLFKQNTHSVREIISHFVILIGPQFKLDSLFWISEPFNLLNNYIHILI